MTIIFMSPSEMKENENKVNYELYKNCYQGRYLQHPFTVTWKHISFWRKGMNEFGNKLIGTGDLTPLNFLIDKNIVIKKEEDGTIVDIEKRKQEIQIENVY